MIIIPMLHTVKVPLALRARSPCGYRIREYTAPHGMTRASEASGAFSIVFVIANRCPSVRMCPYANDLTKTLVVLPNTDYTKSVEIQF